MTCLLIWNLTTSVFADDDDDRQRRWSREDRAHERGRDRDRDGQGRDDRDRNDRAGRRPAVTRTVRYGTTVTRLPRGYRDVTLHDTHYFVCDGVAYVRGSRPDTYVVVRPPVGLTVTHLPSDYVSLQIGGLSFYYYDDAYYNDRLEVVDCPVGGTLAVLPEGYEAVDVRGVRYYRRGDRYFKPLVRAGKRIFERVVVGAADLAPAQWEPLGSARISFRGEQESIPSGLRRGRFRQMRIDVTGGDVDIDDLDVRFANGEVFSPNLRQRFDENTRSRTIDLPGDDRIIREVRFRAKSKLSLAGKATISIWVR